ncbi:MAG TPA: hypothetical protein VHB68_02180 [Steroidobacteraceae bacterium]|nr:hypothetical protein [Steroidobacteraceae bacterium]
MLQTEDQYRRERRASDLAWRMLGLQARSGTICRWTGVTPRRVRRLYHSYFRDLDIAAQRRPRGRAPHCIELLLRPRKQRDEALELARVYHHMGLLKLASVPPHANDRVRIGETLCDAFETFKIKYPNSTITLEHGVLLLSSVIRAEEILLHCCGVCQNLMILDRLQPPPRWCAVCSAALEYPPSFQSRTARTRLKRGPLLTAPVREPESWSPRLAQLRRRRQLRTIATITGPQMLRQKG